MNAVRTCVGCRQRANREALLRVVIRSGELHFDQRASLPGRGAWLHPSIECFELASSRGGFAKALRVQTSGSQLREQAEKMLAKNE